MFLCVRPEFRVSEVPRRKAVESRKWLARQLTTSLAHIGGTDGQITLTHILPHLLLLLPLLTDGQITLAHIKPHPLLLLLLLTD